MIFKAGYYQPWTAINEPIHGYTTLNLGSTLRYIDGNHHMSEEYGEFYIETSILSWSSEDGYGWSVAHPGGGDSAYLNNFIKEKAKDGCYGVFELLEPIDTYTYEDSARAAAVEEFMSHMMYVSYETGSGFPGEEAAGCSAREFISKGAIMITFEPYWIAYVSGSGDYNGPLNGPSVASSVVVYSSPVGDIEIIRQSSLSYIDHPGAYVIDLKSSSGDDFNLRAVRKDTYSEAFKLPNQDISELNNVVFEFKPVVPIDLAVPEGGPEPTIYNFTQAQDSYNDNLSNVACDGEIFYNDRVWFSDTLLEKFGYTQGNGDEGVLNLSVSTNQPPYIAPDIFPATPDGYSCEFTLTGTYTNTDSYYNGDINGDSKNVFNVTGATLTISNSDTSLSIDKIIIYHTVGGKDNPFYYIDFLNGETIVHSIDSMQLYQYSFPYTLTLQSNLIYCGSESYRLFEEIFINNVIPDEPDEPEEVNISGKWKHSNAVYTGGQYLNEELSGVVIYSASDSSGRGKYSFNSILLDTTSEPFIYYKNDNVTVCYYRLYIEDAVKGTIVDFGEQEQSVSQEFYAWFTSAFTQVQPLTTTDEAFDNLADAVRESESVTGSMTVVQMIQILNSGNAENSEYDSSDFDSVMTKLANVIRLRNNFEGSLGLQTMPSVIKNIP